MTPQRRAEIETTLNASRIGPARPTRGVLETCIADLLEALRARTTTAHCSKCASLPCVCAERAKFAAWVGERLTGGEYRCGRPGCARKGTPNEPGAALFFCWQHTPEAEPDRRLPREPGSDDE